jgi:hypothetical protein|tara:strand:- start:402 stop:620 length:219 start_codon:yes stop_codon:yes gene_type:complete
MDNKKLASSNNELLKEILENLSNITQRINLLQNDVVNIKKVVTEKDISYIEFEEPEKDDKLSILDNNRGWFF